MATWEIIFTSPEDENWHLVSNGPLFSLYHKCKDRTLHSPWRLVDMFDTESCYYCHSMAPDALYGMLALTRWNR